MDGRDPGAVRTIVWLQVFMGAPHAFQGLDGKRPFVAHGFLEEGQAIQSRQLLLQIRQLGVIPLMPSQSFIKRLDGHGHHRHGHQMGDQKPFLGQFFIQAQQQTHVLVCRDRLSVRHLRQGPQLGHLKAGFEISEIVQEPGRALRVRRVTAGKARIGTPTGLAKFVDDRSVRAQCQQNVGGGSLRLGRDRKLVGPLGSCIAVIILPDLEIRHSAPTPVAKDGRPIAGGPFQAHLQAVHVIRVPNELL